MVISVSTARLVNVFKNNILNIVGAVEAEEADMTECVTDSRQDTSISSQYHLLSQRYKQSVPGLRPLNTNTRK